MSATLAEATTPTDDPRRRLRARHRAGLPRVRPRGRARTPLRLSGVLRAARGRLRLPGRHPRGDRGRARATSGATRRCCRSPATSSSRPTPSPASPGCCRPTTSAPSSGIDTLWVKDDSTNPTNSFKDRVVACALSAAREFHAKVFACPSTGNLANAVAAAGARAGIKTVVFIPSNLEHAKQVNSAVYTDSLVAVNGNYDDVNKLASEIAGEEDGWAFVNVNVRPYYAEGSKTLGYEIAEQLGWRLPDQVVIPVASGSQLTKVDKAFQELIPLGLVEDKPYRIYGAQATGCSPVRRRGRPASTRSARSSPTRSPSRWRSATRPTASTCSTSAAAPAAPSRTSPTRRSARASCCWPATRASSPRPPAARPSAC